LGENLQDKSLENKSPKFKKLTGQKAGKIKVRQRIQKLNGQKQSIQNKGQSIQNKGQTEYSKQSIQNKG
jgi:hypothetical protein